MSEPKPCLGQSIPGVPFRPCSLTVTRGAVVTLSGPDLLTRAMATEAGCFQNFHHPRLGFPTT